MVQRRRCDFDKDLVWAGLGHVNLLELDGATGCDDGCGVLGGRHIGLREVQEDEGQDGGVRSAAHKPL
jgi:hypothetical protein